MLEENGRRELVIGVPASLNHVALFGLRGRLLGCLNGHGSFG